MTLIKKKGIMELREDIMPVRIVSCNKMGNVDQLLQAEEVLGVSFRNEKDKMGASEWTEFQGQGSYVILDFGREICGGLRMIMKGCATTTRFRLTFGESLTEATSSVGEMNAGNDHSPRDFEVLCSNMSDLEYGQTGFRFVRIELLDDSWAVVQQLLAVSVLPYFEKEAKIKTNDERLNQIIETAAHTLKLCFQKGLIWDGIKRDRLVWSGDLHPEIITSLYLFGDTPHIQNSLRLVRNGTTMDRWVNDIPSYSAWWVINLCDYCSFTDNQAFFEENRDYALHILEMLDACVTEDGEMSFDKAYGMDYFLDWPSNHHPEAVIGTAALIIWMAQKFSSIEENEHCENLKRKLSPYLEQEVTLKNICAFQILAGKKATKKDVRLLQEGGAKGVSTFMSYYVLTAMAKAGGTDMLAIAKEYYGGMLDCGATSFWEDFDIEWLENSSRVDEVPKEGQRDIHADFGKYCYKQLRHSLCHGWSSGVLAFIIEYVCGVNITDGGRDVHVTPHLLGLTDVEMTLPVRGKDVRISIHNNQVEVRKED